MPPLRVCLLTPSLPYEVTANPVGEYARGLATQGDDVTVALTRGEPPAEGVRLAGAHVSGVPAARERAFDVAVAMSWQATVPLFELRAERHAYRVEGFAHRRMGTWQAERVPAALSYDLPVDLLAAAQWIADALAELRPDARCALVPSGVAKEAFDPAAHRTADGALRVLVEGESEMAQEVLRAMSEPHAPATLETQRPTGVRAEAYAGGDVLLALDAPGSTTLEAMHMGVVPVVLDGEAEIVAHGESGVVGDHDDPRGLARWLDLLAREPDRLAALRAGARRAAGAQPSWAEATATLRAALERFLSEPPPDSACWPARLMADAVAQSVLWHNEHHALAAAYRRMEEDEAYRLGLRLREAWQGNPRLAPARRVAAPLVRRARRRLLDQ